MIVKSFLYSQWRCLLTQGPTSPALDELQNLVDLEYNLFRLNENNRGKPVRLVVKIPDELYNRLDEFHTSLLRQNYVTETI